MDTKLEIIFFILILLYFFVQYLLIIKTEKRLKRFSWAKKAKDLEDTLIYLENEVKALKAKSKK